MPVLKAKLLFEALQHPGRAVLPLGPLGSEEMSLRRFRNVAQATQHWQHWTQTWALAAHTRRVHPARNCLPFPPALGLAAQVHSTVITDEALITQ